MTRPFKVTTEWRKISDKPLVLQNRGEEVEVAVGNTSVGFILKRLDFFTYPGGEDVYVRSKKESYIVVDVVGEQNERYFLSFQQCQY